MIDFKILKSLIINGQSVKTLSIDGSVVWSSTPVIGWKGLKFKAEAAGSTVYMYKGGSSAPSMSLMYSLDDGDTWNDFTVCSASDSLDGTIINLDNVGDSVCFKGNNTRTAASQNADNCNIFGGGGGVSVCGNVMSLLFEEFEGKTNLTGRISRLFQNNTALIYSHDLKLPATSFAYANSYQGLFLGCSKLMTSPKVIPDIPFGSTSTSLFVSMFQSTNSLLEGPHIQVKTLGNQQCMQMFRYCSKLKRIKVDVSYVGSGSSSGWFSQMFNGCQSLELIDWTRAEAIPRLNSTDSIFGSTNNTFKMVVPDALYDDWIEATNWASASIKPHIMKQSDWNAEHPDDPL